MFTPYLQIAMKGIFVPAITLTLSVMTMTAISCKQETESKELPIVHGRITPPDWSHAANIYEVNIRQYTPEGTFNAGGCQRFVTSLLREDDERLEREGCGREHRFTDTRLSVDANFLCCECCRLGS